MTDPVLVGPGGISPADVVRTARELALVELSPEVEATILAGRAVVDRLVAGDRLIYGLNTGLGHMRDHRVPLEVLQRYQRQMIEAHASGIGPPLDTEDDAQPPRDQLVHPDGTRTVAVSTAADNLACDSSRSPSVVAVSMNSVSPPTAHAMP